jgi:hypothetical protein
MVYRGVEGFDGGVNGCLNTDKNAYSQGDSYNGKKGSPFVVIEMAKGDVSKEVKEDHKLKMSNVKARTK